MSRDVIYSGITPLGGFMARLYSIDPDYIRARFNLEMIGHLERSVQSFAVICGHLRSFAVICGRVVCLSVIVGGWERP